MFNLVKKVKQGDRESDYREDTLQNIPIEFICPDLNQDRKSWNSSNGKESLERLTYSIRLSGIRRPIEVQKIDGGKYQIISGERRWRAAESLKLTHIPCLVRHSVTSESISLDQLTENMVREDLNVIEQAQALYKRLAENVDRDTLLSAIGRSSSWLSKRLSLLKTREAVQELARDGLVVDPDTLLKIDKFSDNEIESVTKKIREGSMSVKHLLDQLGAPSEAVSNNDSKSDNKAKNAKAKDRLTIKIDRSVLTYIMTSLNKDMICDREEDDIMVVFEQFVDFVKQKQQEVPA